MKKNLFLVFAVLFGLAAFSQTTFSKAYHNSRFRAIPSLINIHGDLYFSTIDPTYGSTSLYKHSASGTLKFGLSVLDVFICTHMHKTNDNKLALTGWFRICDVGQTMQRNVLCKVDTAGNAVFTTTFQTRAFDDPKVCIQAADSSYLTFTDSLMFRHSKTGQFISKVNLGLNNITSAVLLPNGNILLSAAFAFQMQLVTISPSGVTLNSILVNDLFSKLYLYGGQKIMARATGGRMHKFRADLSLIATSSLTTGFTFDDFVYANDSVYSIMTNQGVPTYAVADTSFNLVSVSSTTTNLIFQTAIAMNGSKVAILFNGATTTNTSNYFVGLSSISKNGNNNFTNDVGIEAITADSTYSKCNTQFPPSTYCTVYLRPKVKIKNNGNTVINNVMVNCVAGPNICGDVYYQWPFTNLSLQPGDSATLLINQFVFRNVTSNSNTVVVNEDFCFFTSVPNGEADKTVEDNDLCQNFTFLVTSLKEQVKAELNILVSPNPFQSSFTVRSDVQINKVNVYNAIGALISSQAVSDIKTDIDCSGLPSGVYILKIEGENGIAIKKILKN